jgi:hypothetical protein
MISAAWQAFATGITLWPSSWAFFQLEPPSFNPTITFRPESFMLFA